MVEKDVTDHRLLRRTSTRGRKGRVSEGGVYSTRQVILCTVNSRRERKTHKKMLSLFCLNEQSSAAESPAGVFVCSRGGSRNTCCHGYDGASAPEKIGGVRERWERGGGPLFLFFLLI